MHPDYILDKELKGIIFDERDIKFKDYENCTFINCDFRNCEFQKADQKEIDLEPHIF